jgi:hypothetical protein
MRVALDRIDVQNLGLDLDKTGRVDIASASALHGAIDRTDDRLGLEGFGAEEVILRSLHLALGSVGLTSQHGATILRLGLKLEQHASKLDVDVEAVSLAAKDLGIAVETAGLLIQGKPTLSGVRLSIRSDGGSLVAEGVEAIDLVVKVGALEIQVPALRAYGMRIGWGTKGFELSAEKVDAPGLRVRGGAIAFDGGALGATKIDVGPATGGTGVRVARVTLERGSLRATLAPANDAEPPPSHAREPIVDVRVLDFLSGNVDVDALVDVSVPILGRRRATHAFRIPIEHGTIDFRELEADLATLEDAVLDFAVRDGALVLERKNPLLPVRGHGKPIVVWNIESTDLELAERNRVRLSVLSNPKAAVSASMPPPAPDGSKSSFALRELGLHRIDATLTLAPVDARYVGRLRPKKVGSLAVEGQLVHTPDESSPEGRLVGGMVDVALAVHALEVSTQRLDIADAAIAKVTSFDIAFADIVPTAVSVDLEGVTLEALTLVPSVR